MNQPPSAGRAVGVRTARQSVHDLGSPRYLRILNIALSSGFMLSIEDLRFFAILASSPSLAAAARAMDVTPPAVTQRLQLIERKLGIRLVDRSGRRMALTDEGDLLATHSQRIRDELGELEESLLSSRGVVSGRLRVIAPFGFGRRYVAPAAAHFLIEHPRVTLSFVLSDRPGCVADDTWDLLIQIGELRDSSLVVRRLAPNQRFICASPDYVARRGTPTSPEDLRSHDCIALRENDEDVTLWRFAPADGGDPVHIRIEPRLASNDGEVALGWALAGLGVICRSEWAVVDYLRTGHLVRLLGRWQLPSADVSVFFGPT
ncbi:MAG: LysR family transcriptional regulator, partial [Spirochaetes bacterium]|nr:LysR family transcriptional regulator [Spirochaetota bacterium]